jgi:hypothetical protein
VTTQLGGGEGWGRWRRGWSGGQFGPRMYLFALLIMAFLGGGALGGENGGGACSGDADPEFRLHKS